MKRIKVPKYIPLNKSPNSTALKKKWDDYRRGQDGRDLQYNADLFVGQAYVLCRLYGATNVQLGEMFGVLSDTIWAWTKRYPDFSSAIKEGKKEYNSQKVEKSLLGRALGFDYWEEKWARRKVPLNGDEEKFKFEMVLVEKTKKKVLPDVGAIVFWLTNQQPEDWKNTRNVNVQGNVTKETRAMIAIKIQVEQLKNMRKEDLEKLAELLSQYPDIAKSGGGGDSASREVSLPLRSTGMEDSRT